MNEQNQFMNQHNHSPLIEAEQKMLYFLRCFRVATRGQLLRAAGGGGAAQAAFNLLVGRNQIHARNVEVPLNPEAKPRAGRAAARLEFYKHADDCRREKHTLHDLYVAEAFLFCCGKFRFEKFATEDEIRQFGARGCLPDFTLMPANGDIDCEVVLQNNREDLESKSSHWLFFTPSQRQADAIRAIKKAKVYLLPSLLPARRSKPKAAKSKKKAAKSNQSAAKSEQTPAKSEAGLSVLERTILVFLRSIELPVNAAIVQKFVKKHRPDVAGALATLHRKGFVYATEIAQVPGISRGRPGKYFSIDPPKRTGFEYRMIIAQTCRLIISKWPVKRDILEILLERRF